MNLLDENFPRDQRAFLAEWRIPHRQIGDNFAAAGIGDAQIISLFHRQRGITFFTQDQDFFEQRLSHPAYALIWLDVKADDTAACVRRFLRHPEFRTQAQRMGVVARVHRLGVDFWGSSHATMRHLVWK